MPPRDSLIALLEALPKKKFRAVHAVVGEDPGIRKDIISRIRRAILGEDTIGGGPITFGPPDSKSGTAPTLAEILDEVRTPSLFSSSKLVLVHGADALFSTSSRAAGKDKGTPSAQQAFIKYIKAPASGTVLILEFEKLDKRSALFKALVASDGLIACPRLFSTRYGDSEVSMASSMGAYLRQLAKERGLRLSDGAGKRLMELCGGETEFLTAELDKLAEYLAKEKREVRAEDVEKLASRGALSVLPLIRDALSGKTAAALRATEQLFSKGMESFNRLVWDPTTIAISMTGTLARELQTVERTIQNGGRCPPTKRGKSLPPQIARPIEEAARRMSGTALERAYQMTLEAELALKSSSGQRPQAIVEELLVRL